MIFGIVFLIILLAVARQGGDLRRLADVRLRHAWLVALALVVQIILTMVVDDTLPEAVAAAVHVLTYGFALAFVWFNRRVPGIAVTVAGGLMNLLAIAANGGVMPASAAALEFAGIEHTAEAFENSAVRDDARLLWLGDVFALPEGFPFANVFSVGDVVLLVGGYRFVSRACLDGHRPRHALDPDEVEGRHADRQRHTAAR